jgi:hypothetical protein
MGVSAWRKQLQGGAQFDIARKLLSAVSELGTQFHPARMKGVLGSDGGENEILHADAMNPNIRMESIFTGRQRRVAQAAVPIQSLLTDAEYLMSEEVAGQIRDILTITRCLIGAIDRYVILLRQDRPDMSLRERANFEEEIKPVMEIISADRAERDQLGKEFQEAREALTLTLRNVIQQRGWWDVMKSGILNWGALTVALAAAAFSALQWHEARVQTMLSSTASIGFDIDTDPTERRLGVEIRNSGPGVATVRSIEYFVDSKQITDINDALQKAQLIPEHELGVDLESGDPIGTGDLVWVLDYRPRDTDERERAIDFIESHFAVKLIYCSLNGECRAECSEQGRCGR